MDCRTGDIVFRGPAPKVAITSGGTGTVYVSGVTGTVDVNLSGIGNAVIDAASGEMLMTPEGASVLSAIQDVVATYEYERCESCGCLAAMQTVHAPVLLHSNALLLTWAQSVLVYC